jgi:AraC-like DNA-binding protein
MILPPQERIERPTFDPAAPHIAVRLGTDDVTVSRVSTASSAAPVDLSAPPQDTFELVLQLGAAPAHELEYKGRQQLVPRSRAGSLALFDLAEGVRALMPSAIDSLHIRLPKSSIDAFADEAGLPRIERLKHSGNPFSIVDPTVEDLVRPLLETVRADTSNPVMVQHLVLALIAHLHERYGDGVPLSAMQSGGLAPWQVRRSKEMLATTGDDALSLRDVASACGVSPAHFSRAFKRSVGLSPWAWHQARRIEMAEALLRDPALSLGAIAAKTGFADQGHFTRAFARDAGETPGRWRRARGIRPA